MEVGISSSYFALSKYSLFDYQAMIFYALSIRRSFQGGDPSVSSKRPSNVESNRKGPAGTSKKKKRGCCVDIPSSESDEEDWAPTPTREDNQPNRNMMVDDTEVAKDVHLPTAKCVGRITLDIEDWRPEVLTVCPSSPDTDSPIYMSSEPVIINEKESQ
uniref:Uncharacterized protein n=3 Tax=Oryza TaxID=4527 RepID=A0A5S6RDR3_ORYSJ|nr:hypothetical protein [Oryza sativa Japonica Group]AAP53347.1 hypothetical protein LOC_Os10g22180 [Oryza sativa Japonica Group]